MSTAVVTGAAGFIGSHLVKLLLEQGHTVRALDIVGDPKRIACHISKPNFSYRHADIRYLNADPGMWEDVDWVFHLAGRADIVPSIEYPDRYMDTNVMGTVKVLEAARRAGVKKFVYAASSSCYGDNPETPTGEEHPINTCYPYAESKYLGERACLHWLKVYGLPVNSLRLSNVYGLQSRTSGAYGAVMGVFLKQKLEGAPLTIVGDGSQCRDFVHVRDIARAFLVAAQTERSGNIWNVGGVRPISIKNLAKLIGGCNYPTIRLPVRAGEPHFTSLSISRILADLNWYPEVDFEAGIAEMLEKIEDWRDAPLWTEEKIAAVTEVWHANLGRS